ncbi:MAG TPA: hypothetical protein VFJ74_10005 [Gemmatimonadaceae bacterium]|nr:hypothetical protein [Gemmatimonadaceae bacterium]
MPHAEARGQPDADRSALWLPLLRRFTELSPQWVVWKNADAALAGVGDIDAAAPERDWTVLERAFREWATAQGVGPVVVCHHIPGGLNLVAVPPSMPTLLEVGMKARRIWRGATLFVLDDLVPLMRMDPRGFRRLRPGAEGLLKLLLNGVAWGGRPNRTALEAKGVLPLLRDDPEGVRDAAHRLLGGAADAAIAGAERAAAGGWDAGAMRAVERHALLRAARSPRILGRRALFRARGKAECPVVAAILRDGRRIPDDRAGWLARVATSHAVYATADEP